MSMYTRADYDRLCAYLCDMILEEQLKLGYEKETIRFYSPCTSIGHILGMKGCTCAEVIEALNGFTAYAKETLGEVQISRCSGGRICFLIPAKGAAFVHENWGENLFLAELVECFCRHGISQSDVLAVFKKYSEQVVCIHIGSDDFDDVLYFADGKPDEYRYCVKFDAGHAFYHRFLKEDFEELFSEERGMDTDEGNN